MNNLKIDTYDLLDRVWEKTNKNFNLMENLYSRIREYIDNKEWEIGMTYVHYLYCGADLPIPSDVNKIIWSNNTTLQEEYLQEFLLDVEDCIIDYEAEI